ncbi:aminoacyltransferase [Streptococcus caprae]|uniref:Aminoacyltransferase FemA n=1 Tax=Streptococcus caprae TaxID=1640501 RepID=A0ABV8CU59_9STRE
MQFTTLSKEGYSASLTTFSEVSFLQTVEMAELLNKRGFKVTYVGLIEGDKVLVSAILYSKPMTGGLHMEINSGPNSLDSKYLSTFYKELQAYAKAQGALRLVVKPADTYQTFDTDGKPITEERKEFLTTLIDLGFEHNGLQTGYPGGEPDWHYVKDLSGLDEAGLFKSYSKKGRPLVNKTRTFGIKLRKLQRDELQIFKDITSSTSERREYSDKSLDYYQDFYDAFGDACEFMVAEINFSDYKNNLSFQQAKIKEHILAIQADLDKMPSSQKRQNQLREYTSQFNTFTVRISEADEFIQHYGEENIILAGSLFIYTPHEAVYLFSGSYTEFNKFYAPVALQEHVMTEAIKRGITFYNFLGIQGIFDGSDGVLRFKQNFNGYIVRKMGTFTYYPSPLKFKLITGIKKLLGRS